MRREREKGYPRSDSIAATIERSERLSDAIESGHGTHDRERVQIHTRHIRGVDTHDRLGKR